jgi:hypothetical protein
MSTKLGMIMRIMELVCKTMKIMMRAKRKSIERIKMKNKKRRMTMRKMIKMRNNLMMLKKNGVMLAGH